jgi:2-phosphoglycerate kinase
MDFNNVYWIGGATDGGKSTVADLLADRYGFAVYHYDCTDVQHHVRLAEADPEYLAFINAHLDDRWVSCGPPELFERSLASFRDRWPMVLEDVGAFGGRPVIAEGFGLTPELISAGGIEPTRCVFMVPTPAFKAMSVAKRDKPTWRHQTRDPERARLNILARDGLLAAHIQQSAEKLGLHVVSVEIDKVPDDLATEVARWFGLATAGSD